MKRLILTTALAGSLTGSVALAIPSSGTIVVSDNSDTYSDGGQFTAVVDNDPTTAFPTLCIETDNNFQPGATYTYTLGQATHNNPLGSSPLKLGTAYLFYEFATGQLAGETETAGQWYLPSADVGAVQAALWYFQGQLFNNNNAYTQWGNGAPASDPYTLATINALAALSEVATNANSGPGAYGVDVIESSGPYGGQDWLALGSVPDGGSTVMLLGAALSGIGLLRKKFKA